MTNDVFAVVVNWNGGEANGSCLASLLADGFSPERVVFVDNGSHDGSLEDVEARYPGLVFIRHADNRGFGEGANAGARAALERGARAVFFVNNDVVLRPPVLAPLLAAQGRDPGAIPPVVPVGQLDKAAQVGPAGYTMDFHPVTWPGAPRPGSTGETGDGMVQGRPTP